MPIIFKLLLLHLDGLFGIVDCKYVRIDLHLNLLDSEIGRGHRIFDVKLVEKLLEVVKEYGCELRSRLVLLVVSCVVLLHYELMESSERFFVKITPSPLTEHSLQLVLLLMVEKQVKVVFSVLNALM